MGDEEETLLYCVDCEEEAAALNDEGLCPDCAEPTVRKVHRLALDYLTRWGALTERCGGYGAVYKAIKTNEEITALLAEATKVENLLADAVGEDGDDYVFAYGDDAVLLVGSGEDGVYVVERPLLRIDR